MSRVSTLRDVAKLAGVSVGTVSNYLNKPQTVKEANRELIENAIHVLKYTPNTFAQALATGKSNSILLYILSEGEIGSSTWLHQLPIIQTVNDYLESSDFSLQIKIGKVTNQESTYEFLNNCIQKKNVDGVIILSAWEVSKKIITLFLKHDFPYVLVDNFNSVTHSNDIVCDNMSIVESLVTYLANMGHRKIGFIGVNSVQQHIQNRYTGFCNGIRKNKLKMSDAWFMYGDYSAKSGYACVKTLLKERDIPTAVICGNDNMAMGAIEAVSDMGYSVPGDMSVIGIDNSVVSTVARPYLTTVDMPLSLVAEKAIKELICKIDDREHEILTSIFQPVLIERETVGSPSNSQFSGLQLI